MCSIWHGITQIRGNEDSINCKFIKVQLHTLSSLSSETNMIYKCTYHSEEWPDTETDKKEGTK